MERRFKNEAEKQAQSIRKTLGLHHTHPLLAVTLATHYRVPLLTPRDIPGMDKRQIRQLLAVDYKSWSAVCIPVQDWHMIIYNSKHSQARTESNITHELAHIICGHKPSQYLPFLNSSLLMRSTYDDNQENEANWLCGCLKLPRNSLVWAVQKGMSKQEIAEHFVSSVSLVTFRLNLTGVAKQLYHTQERRKIL